MTNKPFDESGYKIRNKEVETLLRDIGTGLAKKMPEGYGFTLMIYSFGEGGEMFYLSSAVREDMIKMLDEFKQKLISDAKRKS